MNAAETRKAALKEARAQVRSIKLGLEWFERNLTTMHIEPTDWSWVGDCHAMLDELKFVNQRLISLSQATK